MSQRSIRYYFLGHGAFAQLAARFAKNAFHRRGQGNMDHLQSREVGPTGGGRVVISWKRIFGLLFAILALGYGAFAFMGWYDARNERRAAEDYAAFMIAVARADAITDPLQRCLQYPDLPETHWNSDTTRTYCIYRNHHTMQLQDIEALLKAGKADEVDRIFQGYLDTQRRDSTQPGLLDIAFENAGFDDADDNVRRVIDLWKQQAPDSAFALAASGVQYVDAAQKARGTSMAGELDDRQVDGMNQRVALAFKDLDRVASTNSAITPIYPAMIHGAGMLGDDATMYRAAKLGLSVDPANFGIRVSMMNHAQRKWGSYFGGVDAQSTEDFSLANKNPLLNMVARNPSVYRANCDCSDAETHRLVVQAIDKNLSSGNLVDMAADVYDTDRRLAVEIYSEALRFDPTYVDLLRWRSQGMISLGDRRGATATFAAVARLYPTNDAMADDLGNVYAQAGDPKDAEATLLAVLQRDPDNYYAMGVLGDLYNHAGHQPEKAEALADIMIKEHPEKAGGYIVRSCNQMDHNLPGVYDTIHYFIDHFGDDPQWKSQAAEMRAYLLNHPEKTAS